jgi:hypothetical protein
LGHSKRRRILAVENLDKPRRVQPDGLWRQHEEVVLEQNHGGAVTARVEGRAHPYVEVGATFFDSDNQAGDRGVFGFVQGLASLPVWLSRNSKPNSSFVPVGGPVAIVLTANWCYHSADSERRNAWTEASFDLGSAASRTGLGTFTFLRSESRENTTSPPSGRGDLTGATSSSVTTQSLESSASFLTSRTYASLLSTAGVTYTTVTPISLCRVGGYAYLHLETALDIYDEETEETTTEYKVHAWKLNADWLTSSALSTSWYKLIATGMRAAPGTDLVVMALPNPAYSEGGPNPQYLYRVLGFLWSGPDEGDQLLHIAILNDSNGGFATSPTHPISLGIPADSEEFDPGLSERLSSARSRVLAHDNWFWVSMAGQVHAFSVEISGAVTAYTAEWNTYTLGYHDSTGASSEVGQIVATCYHDGYLLAEFSNYTTYETVVDLPRSTAKPNFGEVIPTDRVEPARGMSRRGGTFVLSAVNGSQGSKVFWDDGTSVSVDTLFGPTVDTYAEFDPYVYTGPAAPSGAPNASDFWLTGALDMHFARYHRYY